MATKAPLYRFRDGVTPLNAQELNRRFLDVDARMDPLEKKAADYDSAIAEIQNVGVERINEVLIPAYERIRRLEELGFLMAPIDGAETAFSFDIGQVTLVVDDGSSSEGYRDLFTPSPFVILTREAEYESHAVARVLSYDAETGSLVLDVVAVAAGSVVGPVTDVWAASVPGSTLAQMDLLDQSIIAKDEAETARTGAETARTGAESAQTGAETARGQSESARDAAQVAQAWAEGARDEVQMMVVPSWESPPETPTEGQFWYDSGVNLVRVWDGNSWVPAVSASIGGMRFASGTFGASPDGVIDPGGAFQFVMVFVNGALLRETDDYTQDGSTVTVLAPVEGDEWFVWAYAAIDAADYYTKEEVDGLGFNAARIISGTLADARLPTRLRGVPPIVADWNNATETGWYQGDPSTANGPTSGYYIGQVERHTGGSIHITQTVHEFPADFPSDTKVWRRSGTDGVWTAWYRLRISEEEQKGIFFWKENIVGTVGEASGVPTGAVIERGSNADGEYVRFADGTQICTHRQQVTFDWELIGSLYRSTSGTTWTFPMPFAAPPICSYEVDRGDVWATGSGTNSLNNGTGAFLWTPTNSTQGTTRDLSLMAVGRWY